MHKPIVVQMLDAFEELNRPKLDSWHWEPLFLPIQELVERESINERHHVVKSLLSGKCVFTRHEEVAFRHFQNLSFIQNLFDLLFLITYLRPVKFLDSHQFILNLTEYDCCLAAWSDLSDLIAEDFLHVNIISLAFGIYLSCLNKFFLFNIRKLLHHLCF